MMSGTVRVFRLLTIVTVLTGAAACTSILGLNEKTEVNGTPDAGSVKVDSGKNDAGPVCSAVDGGLHSITEQACWSTYILPASLDADPIYEGATFDGRYLYFVSGQNGMVLRHDTQADFSDAASWSTYATTNFQSGVSYLGTIFDGQYLYLVPGAPGDSNGANPVFIRFDTTANFTDDGSWSSFTLSVANPVLYQGGTFDGRYVYFAPNLDTGGNDSGEVERYDTKGVFTNASSWTSFDTTTIRGLAGSAAAVYDSAVFDGRYVYLIPSGISYSVVARYDTTALFAATASWEVIDTGTINQDVEGFVGAMFDGNYVYLVPGFSSAVSLQYDISKPFKVTSSWQQHATSPNAGAIGDGNTPQFGVGAFDGNYVYYVPSVANTDQANGLIDRYDTTSKDFVPYADAGWSQFNTLKVNNAGEFGSAVFDGKYLNLAPVDSPIFTRFQARDTTSQPKLPHYFGSFY